MLNERRELKFDRFITKLNAYYFLKEKKGKGKECFIIDISCNGAGLEFYTSEKIAVESSLSLEIVVPKASEPIHAKGTVRWVKQAEKAFHVGIESASQSDKDKFTSLFELLLKV